MDPNKIVADVLAVVVTTVLVPLVIAGIRWLAAKMGLTKFAAAVAIVGEAVRGVEQMARANGWEGVVKFDQAYRQAGEMLRDRGIDVSDAELRTLIESAVHDIQAAMPAILVPGTPVETLPPALRREATDT